MATSTTSASTGSGSRLLRIQGMPLGKWLTTTPGRFRLASVVLVGALLIALVTTAAAANARRDAADTAAQQAVPELTATVRLYGFLADADATASIIFLQAGLEDPALHQRYLDDLRKASAQQAIVARQVGSSPGAQKAVRTIAEGLPLYAGDVDSARANIRQGFPVGASYLRDASDRMRGQGGFATKGGILPAATTLYERAARMLDDNYEAGTSDTEMALVIVIGIILLGLLIAVQVLVTQRSNRILNVALVTATIVVLVLVGWTVVRFVSAQNSLQSAQRNGSDSVQLLSAARILALQAQADENHALGERGTGTAYVEDFTSVMNRLGGSDGQGGVLAEARTVAERTGSVAAVDAITKRFQELSSVHTKVRALDDGSQYNDAVTLATGQETEVVHALDASLRSEITRATRSLQRDATDARGGFGALSIAIPVLLVLAGVLVLLGLQRRISEYR